MTMRVRPVPLPDGKYMLVFDRVPPRLLTPDMWESMADSTRKRTSNCDFIMAFSEEIDLE